MVSLLSSFASFGPFAQIDQYSENVFDDVILPFAVGDTWRTICAPLTHFIVEQLPTPDKVTPEQFEAIICIGLLTFVGVIVVSTTFLALFCSIMKIVSLFSDHTEYYGGSCGTDCCECTPWQFKNKKKEAEESTVDGETSEKTDDAESMDNGENAEKADDAECIYNGENAEKSDGIKRVVYEQTDSEVGGWGLEESVEEEEDAEMAENDEEDDMNSEGEGDSENQQNSSHISSASLLSNSLLLNSPSLRHRRTVHQEEEPETDC